MSQKTAERKVIGMPKVTQLTGRDRQDHGFKTDLDVALPVLQQEPAPEEPKVVPGTVTKIDAQPGETGKLKVAAYCRVSTLLDNQEGSFQNQREHYEAVIRSNPEWEYAGVFLENGLSGTKAESRPELQRVLDACKAGQINLILTKSISRFSRNTTDCLTMVRELTALGVDIWFEKEGIHTGTMESEFMLSIMACLAEDESRSISNNLKWGLRRRFQAGTYKPKEAPYGFRREGTDYVIIPEEAEVVKRIFDWYLEGDGTRRITNELNRIGIKSRHGVAWSASTVKKILTNVACTGDILYQKSFMDEDYKQKPNHGELDQYYNEGHHEPIVDKETFARVQELLVLRRNVKGEKHGRTGYKGQKAFSC